MGLSGLEIYKHLPKENCKECGQSTCLAFAMKVAGGQASLDACPRMKDEAKGLLSEASAPPQQLVKIGAGAKAIELGQETVLFRHEDKFHHPTAVAVRISDQWPAAEIEARCREIAAIKFERMGKALTLDLVAVWNDSGQQGAFTQAAQLAAQASGRAVALVSGKSENLKAAGQALKAERPLLWALGAGAQADAVIAAAKELALPLCLEAPSFEGLADLSQKAKTAGLKELVLSPGPLAARDGVEFLTQTRRAAIQKKFRPLGYPIAMLALDPDPVQAVVEAGWYILKYAGIVVIDTLRREHVLGLLTSRQDIYTDPQKPVQVPAGLHAVGEPGPDAPILITTNFALSYYSVEPEVEASRIGSYILAVDTEGTSVLTAWAADKLNAKTIGAALTKADAGAKVKHRKVILPGLVAVLSGSVRDEAGWEVVVGPKEASGISGFLKTQWK